ncbi:MAG: efflux RND transporter periplasmic adaptor subunit [Rikenellaceae bacterium]
MRFRLWFIVALLTIATSCVDTQQATESTRRVKCEAAQSVENSSDSSIYPGKVVAAEEVNRAFRVAGVLEGITVKAGDFVREGAVIATLDSRDYELQLAATQAEYDAIKGEVDRVVQLYEVQSVTENDYDKAVNGLKQIEAKLNSHKNALADTKLTAPFSGYIQKVYFDRGATLSAGMPLISIVSSSAPEVVINIPANEYIKRGELISATAKNELYPEVLFSLKHIGTTHKANLNQLYEARFQLTANEDGTTLSPGMSVMVSLHYGDIVQGAVSIPFSAVVHHDGVAKVWLLESGKVTLQEVTIGEILTDGRAIVTSGLELGDVVVTAGVQSLKEGQSVLPLEPKSDSNVGGIL